MTTINTVTLFDFAQPERVRTWFSLDDGVMGGISQGRMVPTGEGTALFSGIVRLENNGGFSMVRANFQPIDLSDFGGITIRAKADGKRYGMYLRDGSVVGRTTPVEHDAKFATVAGEWRDILVPFVDFRPVWYGQRVPAPALDTRRIISMSLIIEEKQKGAFAIEIARISAYR